MLILASASPRRQDILNQIGADFKVVPSSIEENIDEIEGVPEHKAEQLALQKAMDVASRLETGLVLGADTIVVQNGVIFGKPADENQAFQMLSQLSGKEHLVMTGIALVDAQRKKCKVAHQVTRVRFVELSPEGVKSYLATGEYKGKAGAYGIQGIGALLVEKIEGCYFNVVGLPLARLGKLLKEFGVELL